MPVLSLTKNYGLILQSDRFGKRIATKDVDKYKVVQKGQIVYNPYVIWEGAVHFLEKSQAGLVSPVYPIWEADSENADSYFVDKWLRIPRTINEYNRFTSGAVNRRRSIRKKDFLQIPIPLPPLPEQRAIAYVLRTVQEAKEKTEKVIAAARELKKSLMHHLFTYGPVPFHDADKVKLKETEVGKINDEWNIVKMGEVITRTQYGLSKRGNQEGNYKILRMNNLVDGKIEKNNLQYVDLTNSEFEKYKLEEKEILFNRTNSFELVGKTSIYQEVDNDVFASYLIRLKTDQNKMLPEFLNYYMNWNVTQRRLKSLATRGVSQSNISASKLKLFYIILPKLSEQKSVMNILNYLDYQIDVEKKNLNSLNKLFDSIIHHLMTAKIRVNNINIPEQTAEVV